MCLGSVIVRRYFFKPEPGLRSGPQTLANGCVRKWLLESQICTNNDQCNRGGVPLLFHIVLTFPSSEENFLQGERREFLENSTHFATCDECGTFSANGEWSIHSASTPPSDLDIMLQIKKKSRLLPLCGGWWTVRWPVEIHIRSEYSIHSSKLQRQNQGSWVINPKPVSFLLALFYNSHAIYDMKYNLSYLLCARIFTMIAILCDPQHMKSCRFSDYCVGTI